MFNLRAEVTQVFFKLQRHESNSSLQFTEHDLISKVA
jgi:hypothetical protein